jgi:hypothetical protein
MALAMTDCGLVAILPCGSVNLALRNFLLERFGRKRCSREYHQISAESAGHGDLCINRNMVRELHAEQSAWKDVVSSVTGFSFGYSENSVENPKSGLDYL